MSKSRFSQEQMVAILREADATLGGTYLRVLRPCTADGFENPSLPRATRPRRTPSDNVKGICWMVTEMAAFALVDVFVKAAARQFA